MDRRPTSFAAARSSRGGSAEDPAARQRHVQGIVEGGGRAAGYFTGATGVTIYRGDPILGVRHPLAGMAVVGDVGGNLVHRKRLTSRGLLYRGQRVDANSELLTSEDIWFRPVQFANGPSGGLYVADMYRGGHRTSQELAARNQAAPRPHQRPRPRRVLSTASTRVARFSQRLSHA
ncbi:MAG: hypothetical protein R3B90_10150 [Planctomycetaceae bacterium]